MTEPLRRSSDPATESTFADELLDEVLPESLRWREMVTRYPRFSLAAAAGFGFWLARARGSLVMSATAAWVGTRVTSAVEQGLANFE